MHETTMGDEPVRQLEDGFALDRGVDRVIHINKHTTEKNTKADKPKCPIS
jgi:electron transfer flavoprotein alpha/beta subunit